MNPQQPVIPNQLQNQIPAAQPPQPNPNAGMVAAGQQQMAMAQTMSPATAQAMQQAAQTQTATPTQAAQPQMTTPAQSAVASQQSTTQSQDTPISTQSTLLISELRDNIVIMKDGSFRSAVACQSINFDLMSNAEREGVEFSYQNFLNSLNFTIQILIRSQRVDIAPYIERLTEIRRSTDNMLLTVLMDDYIEFIDNLSQAANIMDKSFFVVIPYYSTPEAEKAVQETKNFVTALSRSKADGIYKIDRNTYDKAIDELNTRTDTVIAGLAQIGIHAVRLGTHELAELYYNFNNPDTAIREPLIDFSQVATTYVKKGESNGTVQ